MENIRNNIHVTADFLRHQGITEPEVGIILGSGLNDYADRIEDPVILSYADIPNFRMGQAQSHRGQLVYGTHMGKKVIVLAGRFHYYECHDMELTAFPTRVLVELGVKRIIITNASGCVNENYVPGQLMIIKDHINMSGSNPLIGHNLDEYGPRFPDMTYTYDQDLRKRLKEAAIKEGIWLCEGVYVMMSGPSFETPAEVRFVRTMGGDAVGMSSVPEAIIANHAGLEVIGVSYLSNMAAGILDKPLSGDEVAENSKMVKKDFSRVIDLAISL